MGLAVALIGLLALAPAQAAAKKTTFTAGGLISLTTTSPPDDHGPTFPVTVSGKVQFGAVGSSALKPVSEKVAKKARKRCRVGFVVPITVVGSDPGTEEESVVGGKAVTDAAGVFSGTLEFNSVTPSGYQLSYYTAGTVPHYIRSTEAFRGGTLKCHGRELLSQGHYL
jgi:hypothetical protein